MLTIFLALATILTVKVTPQACLAPCDVVATVRIQPDPANRYVSLRLQGDTGYERFSVISIEKSPSVFQLRYPSLPEGEYTLYVVLTKADDKGLSNAGQQTLTVTVR